MVYSLESRNFYCGIKYSFSAMFFVNMRLISSQYIIVQGEADLIINVMEALCRIPEFNYIFPDMQFSWKLFSSVK